jgi:hypothetical protein
MLEISERSEGISVDVVGLCESVAISVLVSVKSEDIKDSLDMTLEYTSEDDDVTEASVVTVVTVSVSTDNDSIISE